MGGCAIINMNMQAEQTQTQVDLELSMSHAEVLEVLKSCPEVVDLTTDAATIQPGETDVEQVDMADVPQILLAEMRGVVKSINDVLGPTHFKSDWRVKWEKKEARSKKAAATMKFGGTNVNGSSSQRINNASKKRMFEQAIKGETRFSQNPRKKGFTVQVPQLHGDMY